MKVGILYICTGKYDIFWEDFYQSAEAMLLPGTEKHYFVFTDSQQIRPSDTVHIIFQERLGWPRDTLMRFHLFLNIKEQLEKMDYLFFFNANYTFVKPIAAEELLPQASDHFLVGQWHPVAYHRKRKEFSYETNPASTAFIPAASGTYYYAGGLIGGRTKEFLEMCDTLSKNIDIDFSNHIVAKWHDESHINRYFSEIPPKMLHPGFCYPQGWFLPFERKTLLLDKSKLGGHGFLRGEQKENRDAGIKTRLFYVKTVVRGLLYKVLGYSPV